MKVPCSMEEAKFPHKLPGEHVYDGVLFFGYSPPEVLDDVKEFPVREDDVFIVTYPKAGRSQSVTAWWCLCLTHSGRLHAALCPFCVSYPGRLHATLCPFCLIPRFATCNIVSFLCLTPR